MRWRTRGGSGLGRRGRRPVCTPADGATAHRPRTDTRTELPMTTSPGRLPSVRDRRRPEGRHHRTARGAGHASGALPLAGQGAEVLPDRRPAPAAAGPAGPRGRAQRPGVDLAAGASTSALFDAAPAVRSAGRARPSTSTTAPHTSGWPPRSRTSRWSSSSGTRSTGPTRTGPTCGPTASSRRPDFAAAVRLEQRSGSPPGGRRSGTTAGSAATASSCATCTGTCPASRCSCCATASWSTPRARPWTG